jgi:hypothetical protein
MLTLPIKQKWFDMIVSGEKQEEYRAATDYWTKRFVSELVRQGKSPRRGHGLKVRIRAGYRKNADLAELTLSMITTGTGRPEWGAEPGVEYYVLHIKRVEVLKE